MTNTVTPLPRAIAGSPTGPWKEGEITSSTANLDITGFPADASVVDIILTNIIPTDDARILIAYLSSDNGASFDTGASDYSNAGRYLSPTPGYYTAAAASSMYVIQNNLGTAAGETYNARIRIFQPGKPTNFTKLVCNGTGMNSAAFAVSGWGSCTREAASQVNAIRFLINVGNIASMKWKVYLNQ